MNHKTAACGMYSTRVQAQKSIDELIKSGFKAHDIHILVRKKEGPHNFVHNQPTNIGFGAFIGAIVGFCLLGLVGFVMGYNATAAIRIGEISLYNQSSVPTLIASTFTGAFLGILLGGSAGALAGIGIPKVVNKRYGFYLNEGGLLLAVHVGTQDENRKAIEILKAAGAQDVAGLYDAEVWELALL